SVVNFANALTEAGIPPGVLNVVTGSGTAVGSPLLASPDVQLISFTGSTEVGRSIAVACAETYKRCSLEMGGKNAMIVLDDADLDLAVEAATWGAFGTTGQRCTATSRAIVQREVAGEFVERLVARAQALKVGDGLNESVDMGPCINESQRKTVESYIAVGVQEGARLMTGGHRLGGGAHAKGFFFEPTVFTDVERSMRIAREEIFGPVLSIIPVDDLDEAIRVANDVEYGLSGAVFTKDLQRAFHAMREIEVGIFYINSSTIGAEVQLPFGGVKRTGNGHREAGRTVLDIFTEWKAVYIDFSGRLQKAQIDRTD
ncbi:MAG: aldehyde dehydrogenase family protein, partial [Acidobacteriota bacterium]